MRFSAASALWVTFITIFTQSDCAELEVLINNVNRTTSCVGETVTYVCTVGSARHVWNITGLNEEESVLGGSDDEVRGVFTIAPVSVANGILTSSVSVTSFPGLDGVMLRCRDGTNTQGLEEQTTTATVFGAPVFSVQQNAFILTSFDFIISPVPMPSCISSYTYTATPTDGAVTVQGVIILTDLSSFTESGFDVCKYTYSFTAFPNILIDGVSSIGEMSNTVDQDSTNFTGAAPITGLVETRSGLAWSPPANAIGCSFDYVVIEDGSELARTADTTIDYTFPTCDSLTITVTPVVPSTGQLLTSSSASINILNSSTDAVGTTPDVTISNRVQCGNQVDIIITWTLLGVGITTDEVVEITRGDAREPVATIPVDGNHEGQYIVMDYDYEETSTTFYVRFISGDCMSEESTAADGFIDGFVCTGGRENGITESSVALAVSVPIVMVASLLIGFLLGALAMWCVKTRSCCRTDEKQSPPPPNPVYDEVSHGREDQELHMQLKTNEAYAHVH